MCKRTESRPGTVGCRSMMYQRSIAFSTSVSSMQSSSLLMARDQDGRWGSSLKELRSEEVDNTILTSEARGLFSKSLVQSIGSESIHWFDLGLFITSSNHAGSSAGSVQLSESPEPSFEVIRCSDLLCFFCPLSISSNRFEEGSPRHDAAIACRKPCPIFSRI